jgi:hypothetical protein
MLTESREAMNLSQSSQNLAIASLSSPQFDANPFSAASGNVPVLSVQAAPLMCCRDGAGRALMGI